MDLQELLALLDNLASLTDDELAGLLDDLSEAANARLDGELTDEALAELESIRDAAQQVRGEQDTRAEASAEREARAADLRREILGEEASDEDEGDGDEGDEAAADDAEGGEAVEGTEGDGDTEATEDEVEVPEPVAAAATRPRVGRVAARRPASTQPRQRPNASDRPLVITASANLPGSHGIQPGQVIDPSRPEQLAAVFEAAVTASANYRGPRTKIPLLTIGYADAERTFGAERTLGRDEVVNRQRIDAVAGPDAIVASGGACAPTPVRYEFPGAGVTDRPVRDSAMTRFGADRGGVRLYGRVTLADVAGGVDDWTNANDQTPSDPTTKPCVTMTCPNTTETIVEAITRCIEVGNFRARFFPEQVAEWVRMLEVQHARFAENRRLDDISSGSTANTAGQVLGTSTDVMTVLDRAVAGARSRNRDPRLRWRFVAPAWLLDQMRSDIARQSVGTADERLAVADATIESWFRARGVNPSWHLDGGTGQVFPALTAGTLRGWPSTVRTFLYPEGSWLFLDGGSLDLGVVRDSSLNSTNDFQMFAETFEESAFFGIESQQITMDTCPDGSLSALIDIDPCSSGS